MDNALFDPISPENIRQAIEEIDRIGIAPNRHSSTYDVVVNGKKYPPKYVLSLAHKYATGVELEPNQFHGGEGRPAFTFLRSHGYTIIPKVRSLSKANYTWIPFYGELCTKLLPYSATELISLTKQVLSLHNEKGLNDQDKDDNWIELDSLDPYTFLSFLDLGDETRRLNKLAYLKEWLAISAPVPTGLSGLYFNAKWVWLMGYSHERKPGDIAMLRELCQQVETDIVSPELFDQVLQIQRLTPAKLSESLFKHRPERYFPVNSQTRAWLKQRNLPIQFASLTEYTALLKAIQAVDSRPFYELVEEAATNVVFNKQGFTWVPFYQEMCLKLSEYSPAQLISTIKQVIAPENQVGVNDQNPMGTIIELADMDPYTFLSFINKFGDTKRVAVLTRLRAVMDLNTPAPTDAYGLPTAQPQQVWLFSYAYLRKPDDIDQLRTLYQQVERDMLTSEQFGRVLEIRGVGKAKLTESLFYQKPEQYLPINGQTIPWLKARALPAEFKTYADYMQLLQAVKQYDPRPFYEISRQAYLETSNSAQPTGERATTQPSYWVFQGNPNQFRIIDSLKDNALQTWKVAAHTNKIKPGDKVILWVTGNQSGCYALAQVDSEVYVGPDEAGEHYYQLTSMGKEATHRVKITLLHNLWDQPVLKTQLQDLPAFADFNGGKQGTNFTATPEQYELIQHMAQPTTHRFWKYSPGRDANRWPEDIQDRVMAIDFSNHITGSLIQYDTRTDLDKHLGKANGNSNDTSSMMLFKDASIGDVVIANQGLNEVIGIGIISGPYQYRNDGPHNQHFRTVNWLADQPWQYTQHQFADRTDLFSRVTFTRTPMGPLIIQEYVKQYPHYRSIFEQHGLLDSTSSLPDTKLMPTLETNHPKNIILYGPPGTGKTYETIDLSVEIIDGTKNSDHAINKVRFDQLRKAEQIEFVTFHQNYTYEDFVVGIKPDTDAGTLKFEPNYGVFYKIADKARTNFLQHHSVSALDQSRPFEVVFAEFIEPLSEQGIEIPVKMSSGIWFHLTNVSERSIEFRKSNGSTIHTLSIATLKRIYEAAQEIKPNGLKPYYKPLAATLQQRGQSSQTQTPEVPLKRYVLVIDEINRANISRVFGELITLLEEDKRMGAPNELTVTLPNGDPFVVPSNLYLIGTMNTADKSLALLDIALRRRFEFVGKYPNSELLNATPQLKALMERLNKVILNQKKSADFLIGHAYFLGKTDAQLKSIMDNRVIPLLMEYFNGRTDLVLQVLNEAGTHCTQSELTYQIQYADETTN